MSKEKEPSWLTLPEVLTVHEMLLALHGGGIGIRDHGLLESALSRPKNHFSYGEKDLCTLASFYADGIVNNHPFIDGNKRSGFVAAILFLETNSLIFTAPEEQAVIMTRGLATKEVSQERYAQWLRDYSEVRKR